MVLASRSEIKRNQLDAWSSWFREVRPMGSVALKLAYTAAGRGDLWVSAAPKSEWDVCGGDLLVREAGGVFVTVRGDGADPRRYNQQDVLLQPPMLAGPPNVVEEFVARSRS